MNPCKYLARNQRDGNEIDYLYRQTTMQSRQTNIEESEHYLYCTRIRQLKKKYGLSDDDYARNMIKVPPQIMTSYNKITNERPA